MWNDIKTASSEFQACTLDPSRKKDAPEKIMGMLRAFCIHLDMATDSFGIGNRDMVSTLYLKRSIVHVRHTGRP